MRGAQNFATLLLEKMAFFWCLKQMKRKGKKKGKEEEKEGKREEKRGNARAQRADAPWRAVSAH